MGSAAAAVAGEVIGVGIFLTPAGMARQLGSPFWLLTVWLFMGLMAVVGALCLGGLAARYPEAGGAYVYLREAYGSRPAFLYGWMQLLVIDPGVTASLAVGMAAYMNVLLHLSPAAQKILGISVIVVLAALNVRATRLGSGFLQGLTWLKVAALMMLPVWAVALGLGSWRHFTPFVPQRPGSMPLFGALAAGIMAAFYSFGGWWEATKIAEEVRNPQRVMPRALVIGVVAVTTVYILVTGVFVYLVPVDQITSGQTFMAQAGHRLFGAAGGELMTTLVVICITGSMAAMLMLSPRVYYAMARDGLFLRAVAKIHPRFGTPARAIGTQAVLAALLVVLGTFSQIVSYFVFVAAAFLGLTVAGIFRLAACKKSGDGFRVPGYPYTPLAFVLLVAVMLFLLVARSPLQSILGVVVVLAGLPVFRLIRE